MFLSAADFVGFRGAEFEELILLHAFGLANHVDGVVVVFDDCPVGDVFADGGFNGKFVGEFDEEFDVFAFIKLSGKFVFDDGTVDHILMGGILDLQGA